MASAKNKEQSAELEIVCTRCGCKNQKEFYQSNSGLYLHIKKLPICKTCIGKFFEFYKTKYDDDKLAIFYLCRKLDMPFSENAYTMALKEVVNKGMEMYRAYFQKLNSLGKVNGSGEDFESGEFILNDNSNEEFDLITNEEEIEITSDIIRFFGRGLSKQDYIFLVNEYSDWTTRYECDSKAMETLIKQICLLNLDIDKRRANNEKVDQQLKTLQDLLGSSNLKPVQSTGADSAEQATFGTLLKKWENEKPVPEPSEEFKDVDGIKKYFGVWFLGHLCKILNIENSYSQTYSEEVSKYTVQSKPDDGGDV
jgi:hypothetical protein